MDRLRQFAFAVWDSWVALMSGLASLILSVVGAGMNLPGGLPAWTVWVAAVVCFFICCFRVWWGERLAHEQTQLRLTPLLEIESVARQGEDGRYRVAVRNLSDLPVRFSARLESISPARLASADWRFRTPSFLQITGTPPPHQEAVIPGKSVTLVDLCAEWTNSDIGIFTADHPADFVSIGRERTEIEVSAYPVPPTVGVGARRSFYIIPQRDTGLTVSDAGGCPVVTHLDRGC